MDQRKQIVRGLLDEFLTAIRQPDKTSIVPAPNRWFAKPEEFPHVQPMVEKALAASGKTRDDFLHGAFLDPRTGQDLTGRMMSDVGVLIDPRTGRPMMSGRESGMEEFAELEKRLGNQTMSNLVRRSKFKPTGGDTLLNDIPFIATVEQGPHYYGLGTEYASPTQLFQVQTGSNPHLRPKSRGDVFGIGEVVGRMQIGQGPEHDVYEKLFVAPRGSDVPGKKLSKAAGGEVHMAGGGDPTSNFTLSDLVLGKEKHEPTTVRKRLTDELERLLSGSMSPQAVQRITQTTMGGDKSMLPIGIGMADFVPFLGTGMGVEEAARDLPQVYEDLKNKQYLDAAIGAGFDAWGLLPGAAGTAAVGRAALRKAKPLREVRMAGAGSATKEAVKQGVKTAVDTVDDFIKKLYGNKPTGEVNYVTAQEGPFYRVSPSGAGEGQASRTGVREVTGTGEGVGSGGAGAVRGKVAKRYSPEEVARLVRENNIARRAAQKFGGSENALANMPATSLAKQGAIGRAFMEASTDNPQYKQAVYEAYGRQMPELMDTIGARDYDDLMNKAYRQLNYETAQQFNQMPVNMSFHRAGEGDYRSSKEMLEDVHGNNHLYVFQGGEPHNMMSEVDPRTGLNQTEKFRAVHDLFGHGVHGNEFGPKGEELAFGAHSQMYSPLARIALATETRGQNSVVNYTPLNVELKAELAKLDALRYEAMRRGDEGLANEIAQQKRALYGENFQYSPNRGLLLPPEFTDPMFEGGLPSYMSGIFRPSQGTSERLTHFSSDPSLTMTDPSRYGTGIRGEELYRLQGSKAPVMDRTYFYRGDNPRPETGLGQYRYGTQGEDLYSMASDPERLGLLAREANRMPFTARSNQGIINEDQALTDFERLAKEYGYEGLLGDRAAIMYNPAAVERYAHGGEVHMAPGGGAREAAKKGVKQTVDAVSDFLNSLKPGEKPATAADRAAAGRQADAMIQATPQVKPSEALGQAMEKGFKKVSTTQSDRTRVGKGNIGGANFPALSNASPLYANKVWGVMDSGTANRLINLSSPETLWSTVLGSADQLKSNPVVFSKLKKQFIDQMNAGMLHPELEGKINQNLAVLLGEGADIRDPKIWNLMDTFNKRGAMADIMAGKGLPPEEGGVALGGAKGQIFNPTPTLIKETELGLLHPEHGGYVPTYAVGPRLFTLSGQKEYRPDLHTGFPTLLTGQDQGVNMMTTPTEIFLPDWHQNFKKYIAEKNAEKALLGIKPRTLPASYFDLTLGLPGQGLPSQDLNDKYIRHLIREGRAEGGEVHMDKGGAAKDAVKAAVKEAAESLRGYIDPIATKIADWNWRPMSDVRQDVPLTEIPEYIQGGFGNFMAEQAKRADAGNLNARDLIKAYTITRSSVNRGGLPYNTATKTGMQLPRTTEKLVRPEGAFAEWLGSKAGQRYLDDAVLGKFDEKDIEDMVTRFGPFGMPAVLADDMRYAARTLSPKGATISADVTAPADVYRDTSQQIKGIGPAKSGFMASLLGRGDFPTFDARQINLHTGEGGKQAKKYLARGYGEGGEEAVARLADRQRAMNMSIDPALAPFYQHLTHHTVWDALDNSQVTHNDLMKAMRGYADGGDVSDGVTLDEFLSKQGY
jgi:hypothetical protein